MFIDTFFGTKDITGIPTENNYQGESKDKVEKVNPSSDNRSMECKDGQEYTPVDKSEIKDIKLYRYRIEIKDGKVISEEYYPNCIQRTTNPKYSISEDNTTYSKYSKTIVISDREYAYEGQIGKDDDEEAYITKSHYKKLD